MPKRKKRHIDASFKCTVRGKLSTTPSNQTPTQFVVDGEYTEKCEKNGKAILDRRNVKGKVLIPYDVEETGFFEDIPLGSDVVFEESSTYVSGKKFARSFSVEAL